MSQSTRLPLCPYLGLIGDPTTHFREPDPAHRCYSPKQMGDVEIDHQARICFSSEYLTCARFIAPPENTPAVPVTLPITKKNNRAMIALVLGLIIIVPLIALAILPSLLAPAPAKPSVVAIASTATPTARASNTPTTTPPAARTIASIKPLAIPTPPAGGTLLTLTADPNQTGWLSSQDQNSHWGERDLFAGQLNGQTYATLLQFDLSDLPPGSKILYAALEVVGRDSSRLGSSGAWQIEMIDWHPSNDAAKATTLNDLNAAPKLASIGTSISASNLATNATNQIEFDATLRGLLEKQLNVGMIDFRIKSNGQDGVFDWEGVTNISANPPTLYIVAIPAAFTVVTSTPTPANVLTAAANAASATAYVKQFGTPTPMRGIVTPTPDLGIIYVAPQPTPANAATAQYLSAYATAVALTTGTFTPTPNNVRIVFPTATPVIVGLGQLTPIPTATPYPTRGDLLAMTIPSELQGKIIAYTNRFAAQPGINPQPLSPEQEAEANERRQFGANALVVIDPGTSQVVGMLSNPDLYLAAIARDPLSPDHKRLAYVGSVSDSSPQIYLLDLAANLRTAITNVKPNPSIASVAAYAPAWSPSGRQVAYVSNEFGSDDIYIYDLDTRSTRRLTINISPWNKHPSWSPDGKQITFWSDRSGHPQIWIMAADGSNAINLSNNDFNEMNPVWVK